ncbi:MAG: M23 family metallopeptidase [Candidatus Aminicenantes bacterium]|nr:M23 family metallopeptidase [Candidatus Aminicenantes bacterium]
MERMDLGHKIGRNGRFSSGRKPRRRKRALFIILPFIAVIAALIILIIPRPGAEPEVRRIPAAPKPPVISPAPTVRTHKEIISRGSSLAEILPKYGFLPKEVHELKEQVKPVYDLGRIRAGREIRLLTTPGGGWTSLEYDIDENRFLVVRNESGRFRAEIKEVPFEVRTVFLWARIEDNPIAAVNKAGEEDFLALELSDIFGSDIDFYTDIREGDTFRIVYEKKFLNGRSAGYGNILAAEFTNQGKTTQAFRFTYPDTRKSDFFDPVGNSVRKELLKSPMKFARISSRFSSSRLHPIRKIYRPHNGVDYAAPLGSPVQATGDGTVTQAGWNGASGRMIKIRHKNAYETMYLHLSGFAAGIRVGAKVDAKQVIGYVGSSGESTGPHLDYRIAYHGKYVNPNGWKFQPAEPLRKEFLETFKMEMEKLKFALDAPKHCLAACLAVSLF